jgi:hypothetical protein
VGATKVYPVRLLVLGHLVPPLMTVGTAGALLGYSRTHAYTVAKRDGWPMDGGRVIGPAFCDRFGLTYGVAQDEPADEGSE